jgi:hypothetical protein
MKVLLLGDFSSKHTILWFKSYSEFFETYGFSLQKPIIDSKNIFYIEPKLKSEKLKYIFALNDLKDIYKQIKLILFMPILFKIMV